tara:strand:+ start:1059 stop:1397 length:339 start_codon:yes stop_codon:yes gene_type:complete
MNTYNLEELVNLKFTVEKHIIECEQLLVNINSNQWTTFINNQELLSKIILYTHNSKKAINEFLKIQNNMIKNIDEILWNECSHCWVTDVIEEALERERIICYCNKCFIYKKK